VILIIKDPTVTVKCRTAIKALFLYFNLYLLFLYFNLYLSVKLDGLSSSFIFISFLTKSCFVIFALNYASVTFDFS